MAGKRESLWAAYSFSKLLLPVAIFGPATPLLYATCTLKICLKQFTIPSEGTDLYSLESRPSPFRDRFTHAHINGRVYGKIRKGKERAWDTTPESWVMYSDVMVFVVSLRPPPHTLSAKSARAILTPT